VTRVTKAQKIKIKSSVPPQNTPETHDINKCVVPPNKKYENGPNPVQPGDLVRLTGLDWIGHYLMGKLGIVLSIDYDKNLKGNVYITLFGTRTVKLIEDELTIESRANPNERGTM
jgi:hypothetical protein